MRVKLHRNFINLFHSTEVDPMVSSIWDSLEEDEGIARLLGNKMDNGA